MTCNVCGSSNLVEGKVIGADGSSSAHLFVSDDKPFYKKIFGIGGREVHSYACIHCGNLQFTVDFIEEDKKHYLEFEGQQPSLTERLSEDSAEPK